MAKKKEKVVTEEKENKKLTKKELEEQEQKELSEAATKRAKKDFLMEYIPYLIIIFFVVVIRTFIATPVRVNGSSMDPTLKSGDIMILYKLTKKTRGIKRFDIVVVNNDSGKIIKRVIGLPGENIRYDVSKDEDGDEVATLYINGEEIKESMVDESALIKTCREVTAICSSTGYTVPEDEYYVMGDNRGVSKDSRMISSIPDDKILGTTELVMFPFNRIQKVK